MDVINLEKDLYNSKEVIEVVKDKDAATRLYSALCNVEWKKISSTESLTEDELVHILKGEDVWSCSWRYAGGLIANIRNIHYQANEDYMDFYCAGMEGIVSDDICELLRNIGWVSIE